MRFGEILFGGISFSVSYITDTFAVWVAPGDDHTPNPASVNAMFYPLRQDHDLDYRNIICTRKHPPHTHTHAQTLLHKQAHRDTLPSASHTRLRKNMELPPCLLISISTDLFLDQQGNICSNHFL